MNRKSPRETFALLAALVTSACWLSVARPAAAVSSNLKDDFEDGTTRGWSGSMTTNVPDAGPAGAGDNSLLVSASNRIVTINTAQWIGDYTAAGITQLAMDVRNTAAFPLHLRIGIANGSFGPSGDGDTYVSTNANARIVPNDNAWHHIVFDISPGAFAPNGANSNPTPSAAAALASLTHLRILHNPDPMDPDDPVEPDPYDFRGAIGAADFYLDNIQAIPEPAGGALIAIGAALALRRRGS